MPCSKSDSILAGKPYVSAYGLPPGMALWREMFFKLMLRNAASATEFFQIPAERVVELGTQIEI